MSPLDSVLSHLIVIGDIRRVPRKSYESKYKSNNRWDKKRISCVNETCAIIAEVSLVQFNSGIFFHIHFKQYLVGFHYNALQFNS